LYLSAAEDLRGNPGQWAAYNSTGHCVMLAGPGSGKTKTLTLKLARILSEDVERPRGVACITYNNECARELIQRLEALGIEQNERVFIGTVHSFSLTQIILPYARTANIDLPADFEVATRQEQRVALEAAFNATVGGPENPQNWNLRMGRYRRSILNRKSKTWRETDPQLAQLVEAYEQQLRDRGLIDFDDMPLLAVRALRDNSWLQKALLAKFPVLAVDEYQDLGSALHRMVLGLCFSAGIRLFAVGDADQSIYGFTGANPKMLQTLAERDDVETVRLRLNYRCGSRIVIASSYALGEDRDYEAPEGASQGTIFFHPRPGSLTQQADYFFATVLPEIFARVPDLALGDIAILYPTAAIGDDVNDAAQRHGYQTVRTDGNAPYPRSSSLMRWLELCAEWCSGGWKAGTPRFSKISNDGVRLFGESIVTVDARLSFRRKLMKYLWTQRDETLDLYEWLVEFKADVIVPYLNDCRTLGDEEEILDAFIGRLSPTSDVDSMTLAHFSGQGTGLDRISLSTLHSAKGREFAVVVLFAMDQGRIPWNNVGTQQILESRRLFYVGFTRAKTELHIVYSTSHPSPFVTEVQSRLLADEQ
jgi:superfamily I DNA/RNA helicase